MPKRNTPCGSPAILEAKFRVQGLGNFAHVTNKQGVTLTMLDSWGAGEDWFNEELDRRSEKLDVAQDEEFGKDK